MLKNQLTVAGIIIIAVVAVLSLAYVALNPRPVYLTTTANMVETSFVTEMPTSSAALIQTQFTTFQESSAVTQTSCSFPGPSYAWPSCGSVAIYGEGSITAGWGNTKGYAFLYYDGNGVGVIDPMSPAAGVNLSVLSGVCFSGYVEPTNKTFVNPAGYSNGYTTWAATYTFPLIWLTGVTSGNCYPP